MIALSLVCYIMFESDFLRGFDPGWKSHGKYGKNMGKIWEKYGKNMGKIWEKYGKNMGKIWEKYGKNMGKIWEKSWKSHGKVMEKSWKSHGIHDQNPCMNPEQKYQSKYSVTERLQYNVK